MRRLSCLSDNSALLVADTSFIINLNASGCAAEILRALPNKLVIAEAVQMELEWGREKGRMDAASTQKLIDSKHISIVSLGEIGLSYFEQLVAGSAVETLEDGEAATLACALELSATAVIDERKALRICSVRFAGLATASSLDVLGHPEVGEALGPDRLSEAVFLALRDARMRVLNHHLSWIVELLGQERATQCPSLPRIVRFPNAPN